MNALQNPIRQFNVVKLFVLALLSFLAGCSSMQTDENGNWVAFTEAGQASFYGDKHQNKQTASGELYKHKLKTAAHKKLPFGSSVKVTNVDNGKSVIVKINDRGPYHSSRALDMSRAAFDEIGNTDRGTIPVEYEIVD